MTCDLGAPAIALGPVVNVRDGADTVVNDSAIGLLPAGGAGADLLIGSDTAADQLHGEGRARRSRQVAVDGCWSCCARPVTGADTVATFPDGKPQVQDFAGVLVIRFTNTSNQRSVVRDASGTIRVYNLPDGTRIQHDGEPLQDPRLTGTGSQRRGPPTRYVRRFGSAAIWASVYFTVSQPLPE